MRPDLQALLAKEAEASEEFSKAYIRLSLARNDVMVALDELQNGHPTLFTTEA